MIKRIEFSLNLADPTEAQIYRELLPSLRYRRGGAMIRQALGTYFDSCQQCHLPPSISSSNQPQQEQEHD